MAVSSNQKVAELARIAYLVLLHAETELGEETNTFDGDTWAGQIAEYSFRNIGAI
jgi:hypothetical protein